MAVDTPVPTQLGNYDIVSKIAEGGMGTVYKAKNRTTGEIGGHEGHRAGHGQEPGAAPAVRARVPRRQGARPPERGQGASTTAAPMPHPFLVMEFVDGLSIGQQLERKGKYSEAEAVRLIGQVCDGLQRAHKQGLVHRDVKPDNILVDRSGVAKLTDLGLVKEVEGDLNLTRTGRGLGTPHYMAPEQFRNAKNGGRARRHLLARRDPVRHGDRRRPVRQRQPARLLDEEDPQRVPLAEGARTRRYRTASTGRSAGR